MNRRAILSALGCAAVSGLAGCTSDGGDTSSPNETENGTASATDANETDAGGGETPGGSVELSDSSLTVTDTGCGQRTDSAQIGYDADTSEVLITGTIWGSDTCKRPVLADVTYDADADELVVTVATQNPESEETPVCGQCITELGYEARFAFAGGLPGAVTVVHDHGDGGEEIATASRS